MIELYKQGIFLVNGTDIVADPAEFKARGVHLSGAKDLLELKEQAVRGTMAWGIL